jgi:hypothetical protein
MSAEPLTPTTSTPAEAAADAEKGLLIAVALMVLCGVVAMLVMG